MKKQELLRKLEHARDLAADLEIYGPIMDAVAFIEKVPEWVDRSEREPTKIGCYVCEMKSGETQIMSKMPDCKFQTICGTSEGREDWSGSVVSTVIKWSPIYVPEVV